jgi:hypothetical protein
MAAMTPTTITLLVVGGLVVLYLLIRYAPAILRGVADVIGDIVD